MQAFVHKVNKQPLPVKNLGWLVRHLSDVQRVGINLLADGTPELIAQGPGFTFHCPFADYKIALGWLLARRTFKGLPCIIKRWDAKGIDKLEVSCKVGDTNFMALKPYPQVRQ